MSRGPTGEYSIGDQQFNLPVESRKSEGNKGEKRERKQKEEKEGKRKNERVGKRIKEKERKRKEKMNRCMWKSFIYIQAQLQLQQ